MSLTKRFIHIITALSLLLNFNVQQPAKLTVTNEKEAAQNCLAPVCSASKYLVSPKKVFEIAFNLDHHKKARAKTARHAKTRIINPWALIPLPLTFLQYLGRQYFLPLHKEKAKTLAFYPKLFLAAVDAAVVGYLTYAIIPSFLLASTIIVLVVYLRVVVFSPIIFTKDWKVLLLLIPELAAVVALTFFINPALMLTFFSIAVIMFYLSQSMVAITSFPGLNLIPLEQAYEPTRDIITKNLQVGDLFFLLIFTTLAASWLSMPALIITITFTTFYASMIFPSFMEKLQVVFPGLPVKQLLNIRVIQLPYRLFVKLIISPIIALASKPDKKDKVPHYKPYLYPHRKTADTPTDKEMHRYLYMLNHLKGAQLRRYLKKIGPGVDRYINEVMNQMPLHEHDVYHIKVFSICTLISYWNHYPGLFSNDPNRLRETSRFLIPKIRLDNKYQTANSGGKFGVPMLKKLKETQQDNTALFITISHEIGHLLYNQVAINTTYTVATPLRELYAMIASMAFMEAHNRSQKEVLRKYETTLKKAFETHNPTEPHQIGVRIAYYLLKLGYHSTDLIRELHKLIRSKEESFLGKNIRVNFYREVLLLQAA